MLEQGIDPIFLPTMAHAIDFVSKADVDLVALSTSIHYASSMHILRQTTASPIIVFTHDYKYSENVEAIQFGADLYIELQQDMTENIRFGKVILQRHLERTKTLKVETKFIIYHDILLHPLARRVFINNHDVPLTKYEYDILHYFLQHPRQVLTSEQLLERFWNDESEDFTVLWNMIRRLRKKLMQNNSVCSIKTLRGVGYSIS